MLMQRLVAGMQLNCIGEKTFDLFSGHPSNGQLTRALAAEAAPGFDVTKLGQTAAALAARAGNSGQHEARHGGVRTLSGRKCRRGGSGLVHAANQLPRNAAELHCRKK